MNLTNSSAISQDYQTGPVRASNRISSLDIIRGIALLGILMINIEIFSSPWQYLTNPTLSNDFEGSNRIIWFIKQYLFYGKMWSLFSMLFGAGAYLLITRAEEKGNASVIADIYYRRLIFLLLFGLFHAYLVWSGDVLYIYAVVGLFLYPLRKIPFRWMIAMILALFVLNLTLYRITYRNDKLLHQEVLKIEAITQGGKELTEEQHEKLNQWKEKESTTAPDPSVIEDNIKVMSKGSYFKVRQEEEKWVHFMHTELMYNRAFLMTLIMMLLGMALMKSGVLSASLSKGFYLRMLLICYPVGFILVYLRTHHLINNGFDVLSTDVDSILRYVERMAISLGHLGLISLFVKSGTLKWLKTSLAAVGRMAFSNYILQSVICSLIFFGYGWGLYGKLNLTEQLWVVGTVWLFQLIVSPIWLKYFRFGPLEWAWRSLTYLKRQPFRVE
jgi:uncharacterized protein